MKKMLFASILVALLFNGCGRIIGGAINGVTYAAHTATGIDYPKKSGKIYLESTTIQDTKNINPLAAQLYGFDNVVIKNPTQCDIIPELTDVLTEHGWKITKNKKEADYQISTSVIYCGYTDTWLSKSNREIPIKDRLYYKSFLKFVKRKHLNISGKDLIDNNPKALAVFHKIFDVRKFKNYFNVFDYKYEGAPENVKKMANAMNISSPVKESSYYSITADGLQKGASSMKYSHKGGTAMMAAGIILGMFGDRTIFSGSRVQIKIYNPATKKTDVEFIRQLSPVNKNVRKYKTAKYYADSFASGLFYK